MSLADAGGLQGLTMRALAQALHVSPMALYGYVPSRSDLLVLMLDRAYATMNRRDERAGGWRARIEAVARDHRDLLLRHPWIAELPATRPPPGPGQAAKYDRDLSAFDGLGLGALETDRTLAAVLDLASGSARQALAAQGERRASGLTDEAWWASVAPHLDRVFDPDRFPVAARIGTAAATEAGNAYDSDATFELGLTLMLDGLEERLRQRGARID
jgi:AcrR family transcriptional regulator